MTDVSITSCRRPIRTNEARLLVATIAQIRTTHPGESIAVLVRNRSHLDRVLPELSARNISWIGTDIHLLGEKPVIDDLLSLLKCLSGSVDRLPWLAFLRSPLVGLSLPDLETIAAGDYRQRRTQRRARLGIDAVRTQSAASASARRCSSRTGCAIRSVHGPGSKTRSSILGGADAYAGFRRARPGRAGFFRCSKRNTRGRCISARWSARCGDSLHKPRRALTQSP